MVDHELRRRELAEAVLRVIAREGLTGATVRSVAAEAGWTTGALRYYFDNQDDLRSYAALVAGDRIRRRIEARINARHSSPDRDVPLLEAAAQIIEELIPLDDERREEYALWLALTEWERGRGDVTQSPMWEAERSLCRDVVSGLAGRPRPGTFDERLGVPDADPRIEAWAEYLHAFTDGLAAQVLAVPHAMPAERASAAVRSFLAEIADRFG